MRNDSLSSKNIFQLFSVISIAYLTIIAHIIEKILKNPITLLSGISLVFYCIFYALANFVFLRCLDGISKENAKLYKNFAYYPTMNYSNMAYTGSFGNSFGNLSNISNHNTFSEESEKDDINQEIFDDMSLKKDMIWAQIAHSYEFEKKEDYPIGSVYLEQGVKFTYNPEYKKEIEN